MASRICFPDIGDRFVGAAFEALRQNRVESSGGNYYITPIGMANDPGTIRLYDVRLWDKGHG